MIHFFLGTKAQLIKTAPVMKELDRRSIPYRFIDSGQHASFTTELRSDFGLREPDFNLRKTATDVVTYGGALSWLSSSLRRWMLHPKWIRREVFGGENGICVIHGDTISTWLGLLFARRAGIPVAHLEAGLRSFNLFDPFPEEWIRIKCMKKSQLLFAPDQKSIDNLSQMRVRGEIIPTRGNTIADAVQMVKPERSSTLESSYILATFHRLETLRSRSRATCMVEILNHAARKFPVKFVVHKPTRKALLKFGLLERLSEDVQTLPMQNYGRFIRLMNDAKFVFADGGSIQEECSILGKPLLILRNRTERLDGLKTNARLASFDIENVDSFLSEFDNYNSTIHLPDQSPSSIVTDRLMNFVD